MTSGIAAVLAPGATGTVAVTNARRPDDHDGFGWRQPAVDRLLVRPDPARRRRRCRRRPRCRAARSPPPRSIRRLIRPLGQEDGRNCSGSPTPRSGRAACQSGVWAGSVTTAVTEPTQNGRQLLAVIAAIWARSVTWVRSLTTVVSERTQTGRRRFVGRSAPPILDENATVASPSVTQTARTATVTGSNPTVLLTDAMTQIEFRRRGRRAVLLGLACTHRTAAARSGTRTRAWRRHRSRPTSSWSAVATRGSQQPSPPPSGAVASS